MIRRFGNIVLIQLSDIDSNIYLIGDTAIDSGTGFNFTRLKAYLAALNLKLEAIKHIINTHGHFDHIGGNGYFYEADVAIHEADAYILEKGDMKMSYADFFDGKMRSHPVQRKLCEDDVVKAGGLELKVIHTPGHTPGSISLYDPVNKTLFSGDTIFCDGVGRTDMPGGDDEALAESMDKLSKLAINRMFPGHGDPIKEGASKLIKDMLEFSEEDADADEQGKRKE
jgi:glyoxylase-like metal-dependent hydrolase (beta-lactamase superfamily II)